MIYFSFHGPELLREYPRFEMQAKIDNETKLLGHPDPSRTSSKARQIVFHRWEWIVRLGKWKLTSVAKRNEFE